MANIYIDTDKVIQSSQDIIDIAVRLKGLKQNLENVKLGGILEGSSGKRVGESINRLCEDILDEAAKMNSLGDALQTIANKYRKTEEDLCGMGSKKISDVGTDKRGWWDKFWDTWITKKEPDQYDTTTIQQEKAADAAMKKELWNVLQDKKYSQENWDKASVNERKQILQDYMNEVIKIYGLQDVKPKIIWDSNATYSNQKITWGYYNPGKHTVTLNAQALTDSIGNWDSYELLETVSHELRHAYQHEAVDHPTKYMVSQETIDTWRQNFSNYISASDDYDRYRAQPVEVDARDFQVGRDDKI